MRPDSIDTQETASPSFWRAIVLTLEATAKNYKTCISLVALFAVLAGVTTAVGSSLSVETDPLSATGSELLLIMSAAIAGFAAFVVVVVFVYPPTIGALSLIGSASVFGDELERKGILRRVFDRVLETVGAFVLTLFIVLTPPILLGLIALLVALSATAEAGFATLLFALFILVVPTIYVVVRLSLAPPIVLREGLGPVQALQRSWDLVGGVWWWVFGVMLLVGIGGFGVGGLLSTVFSFGQTGFLPWDSNRDPTFVLNATGPIVWAAIFTSLFGVATGVIYAARADAKPPAELELPESATP